MPSFEQTIAYSPLRTAKGSKVGSVLVVGPGALGRGGISAVIRMHQRTPTWKRRQTFLLPTYDDRGTFHKLWIALVAYLSAPYRLARADLLHLHVAAQTSLLRKLPIVAMARLMRKPVIVHFHAPSKESLFRDTPAWRRRFVFRSAKRVIALSGIWAETFAAYEPDAKIVVLANPVQILDPVQHKPGSPQIVLFVGKLEARKGYSDLLNAAKEVLHTFPESQFWFAGQGELDTARQQCDRLGIGGSVRLLGWVDGEELGEIYRQATVVVLPSYAEGVPMSVIEAMSYGIPVVCTPVGGLPELVCDGENGLFATPGDVESISRQINKLLRDPQGAVTIGAAGRTTVQTRCSIENVSEQLDALYADVLGEKLTHKEYA